MAKQLLFQTPLWHFPPANEFRSSIPALIHELQHHAKGDQVLQDHKSNRSGWRIENPHNVPSLKTLGDYMQWLLKQVLLDLGADLNANYQFSSWVNAHDEGGYNVVHHHGISALSGVLYIRVPEGSGQLYLRDPRPGPYFGKQLVDGAKDYVVRPVAGHAVIFPGFLEHWVSPSACSGRISAAFNLTCL